MSELYTRSLDIRNNWTKLEDTAKGVLIQHLGGAAAYYAYSQDIPEEESKGHLIVGSRGINSLLGGNIWVRSEGYSNIAYTPADVNANTVSVVVGALLDLNTDAKISIVEAINELVNTRASIAMVNTLVTLVSETIPVEEVYDIQVTSQMIADRSYTLAHTPKTGSFALSIYTGIKQRNNVDYWIDGATIRWAGLALELLLDTDTVLDIRYVRG